MLKVSNKKIINQIADKSFRSNHIRNTIAVIAIMLTCILFTTVFTIGIGMVETFQYNTMRQSGGDGMGVLKYITDEEYQAVKDHPLIKEISYNQIISDTVDNPEFLKRRVEMYYMDETAIKLAFIEMEEGRAPEKANEIAMDTVSLDLLKVSHKIGEKVTLTMTVKGQQVTRDFVLSGYWKPFSSFEVGFGLVSKEYTKIYEEELQNTYAENYDITGAINSYLMFANSRNLEDKMTKVITESGYSQDKNSPNYIPSNVNWAYLSTNTDSDPVVSLLIGVALCIILLTGYLIIYNIFQISVIQDIRFYGLLKTIGTTGKQIRKIITRQAMRLSFLGIPIGLLLGFIFGKQIVPMIMTFTIYGNEGIKVTANPVIFIGAALFSLFTVWISTKKPGKIAAAVSPVEAVKYTDNLTKSRRLKKSTNGGKIYKMAFSNLGRNKKRSIVVLLSMSLSIVLLNSVVTFVNCFNMDKFLGTFVDTDFLIGHAKYFNYNFSEEDDEVSESYIQAVEEQPGFEEGGKYYYGRMDIFNPNHKKQVKISVQLYGLEDLPLSRIEIIEGETDLEVLKQKLDTGNYIMAGVELDDSGKIVEELNTAHIGDKIVIIDENGAEKECEIIAKIKKKYYINTVRFHSEFSYYTSAEGIQKLSERAYVMSYAFQVRDEQEKDMEQFLENYTQEVEPVMNYESKIKKVEEFSGFQSLFIIIGCSMAAIIGIIGILNFMNVILTSIITRKKEFAMLKAIGMTGRQLRTMICLEGIFYIIGTVLLSSFLSILLSFTLIKGIAQVFWFTSYHFMIAPLLFVIPCLIVIGVIVPYISIRVMDKKSIVEQIRNQE